jgi:hypothetical protein
VRLAIDAQLDPTLSARAQARKLQRVADKIVYWQRRATEATRFHRERRERDLRARGVDPTKAVRCPPWPVLVELDLDDPMDPQGWRPS